MKITSSVCYRSDVKFFYGMELWAILERYSAKVGQTKK